MSPLTLLSFSLGLLLITSATSAATATGGFLLPLVKDVAGLQYYTSFLVGTPQVRVRLSIDIGNPSNWFLGPLLGYNQSSTYHSVAESTTKCPAYAGPNASYMDCAPSQPLSPTCNYHQCMGWASNPFRLDFNDPRYYGLDPIVEDVITPLYRRGTLSKATLPRFPFVDTADKGPLMGLSQYTKGILSLSRSPMALHFQIASAFKTPRKFALCLPSSSSPSGAVYFGGGPYALPPSTLDFAAHMAKTPLVSNSRSVYSGTRGYEPGDPAMEYYIKINSIQVDGAPVKFNSSLTSIDGRGDGGAKLSSMVPYTKLHPQIYPAFATVFVHKAKALNISVAGPVSPFSTCFNSAGVKYNQKSGSGWPVVDLIMAGSFKWRIYGSNSMVKVSANVYCLGIVNAGQPKATDGVTPAIVIGAKQMEDNLVEFDLESSKIGVTSSLLRLGTSCSQIKGI